jgi:hypothetical protein
MLRIERNVREVPVATPGQLPKAVLGSMEPLVLRGLAGHWPVVQAAGDSPAAVEAYLRRFYGDEPVNAVYGQPGQNGRLFYNDDLSGFNFQAARARLDKVIDDIRGQSHAEQPAGIYVGSTSVDSVLPGFRSENDIKLDGLDPLVFIWLGNRSRIAAHFDLPDNLACCAAGRRRFTLFPPAEIANLYPGPIDFTPAGQTISMVDFAEPDFERFPRFGKALESAQLAELEPGDAVYVPSMWWHHVEGLDSLNVLVNYWWRSVPAYMDTPANVLEYALLAIRDLPKAQREAWRAIFDFYVFDFEDDSIGHIPESRRGVLAPMDEMTARRLRAQLLKKINR